jgi:hypothetical protein
MDERDGLGPFFITRYVSQRHNKTTYILWVLTYLTSSRDKS